MKTHRKLIVVGQTPPPYNGQATMIRQMIEGLQDDFDLLHIRMAYSESVASAGKFGLSKIFHLFRLIGETRRALKKYPGAVLYYPPASPNLIPVLRDIIYLSAVRPLAGKTVFHFHSGGVSDFVRRHAWLKPFAMKAYGEADAAIELGNSCPRDGAFFDTRDVRIVPYGINLSLPADLRSAEHGNLRILYVGIHTETKGLFDLLETARELKRRGVRFEIRTAGLWYRREEEARFNQLRSKWGLDDCVQALGQKTGEDLWALYRCADVFFFPTFYAWETFGIVQLEAMAHRLPVVASRWQGPADVVVDGETGFLCPVHDVAAFADALERVANDRELCRRMGRAGEKRYAERFTADCFVSNLKRIFGELCL